LAHILTSIVGLWLLFLILRSMIRIALMNRHYRDFFAELTGRAVYTAVALRLGRNRDAGVLHRVLLWVFPAYLLSSHHRLLCGSDDCLHVLVLGNPRRQYVAPGVSRFWVSIEHPRICNANEHSLANGWLFQKARWGLAS
jgi:hypothetical protein